MKPSLTTMPMQKPFTTALALTGLASLGLLVAGCGNKKTENTEDRADTPGVTASEIKIGQSMPYSGPASAYGVIAQGEVAYFNKMINAKGGINGRKVTLVSLDDGYSPPRALENVRKLVENEHVAFIFSNVGTATNTAVQKYLNERKVPQLFVATGADKWADPAHFPWTIGFQPSYRGEARIYARYLMRDKPAAKLCVLFQNDDFGKDYLVGLKEGFGDQYDKFVIKTQSYEVSDPTIDSQIVTLQAAGCDALLSAATPKFGAQAIRKVFDLGWKPLHIISNVSISRSAVMVPAGLDKSAGLITAGYIKDITDPSLASDAGMNEYREFARQYLTGLDTNDGNLVYAYAVSVALTKVLSQCGNDLSRENIMKQATNLTKIQLPVTSPGLELNTSPTDFRPLQELQLARFNGNNFESFGEVLSTD